ncbi:Flp family type IVb pilin [Lottiidibacillus patelloidae]|uniref:Flp family type IVb pilin n=1 Tax=Lottiidibacillus patelloidae TaxID=2670334 RepID=A0A263BY99_9BACI|nr:Flp family type IVb pilin [Lottiidibacillus patelloidae]OZM58136.1 Flp family type IVb pilin [Lottiidibacillus patelloidae]
MMNKLKGLVFEEKGQGMTEYGLVLGVIAVGVVALLATLRDEIMTMFNEVINNVTNRDTGGTATTSGTGA